MVRVSLPHSHLHCTTLIRNVNIGIDRLEISDRLQAVIKKTASHWVNEAVLIAPYSSYQESRAVFYLKNIPCKKEKCKARRY